MLGKRYLCAVVTQEEAMHGLVAPANWPTIQARDYRSVTGNEMSQRDNAMQNLNVAVTLHGLPAPANPSTDGSHQESWATPNGLTGRGASKTQGRDLLMDVKQWATPRSRDAGDWMMNKERLAAGKPEDTLTGQATQSNKSNGKLNPRWVETLMGLPVGWTMPSCASPVTIAPTNSAFSATESSPPLQP